MTENGQHGRTMSRQFKQMTAAEARTAFYVDFEGGQDAPPVLMGILRKHTQQYVVEPAFRPLGPAYLELRQAVASVVTRAEKQARRIVSWSEHDLEIVHSLTKEPDLIRRFEARYANGRALAARWATLAPGVELPAAGDLELYLQLIGFDVPESAGPGTVGATVGSLRQSLDAGRQPSQQQAQRWADLLEHNHYDCLGTRAVCIRAAGELERLDERMRKGRRGRKKRRRS
jgi:hypothetical protein